MSLGLSRESNDVDSQSVNMIRLAQDEKVRYVDLRHRKDLNDLGDLSPLGHAVSPALSFDYFFPDLRTTSALLASADVDAPVIRFLSAHIRRRPPAYFVSRFSPPVPRLPSSISRFRDAPIISRSR